MCVCVCVYVCVCVRACVCNNANIYIQYTCYINQFYLFIMTLEKLLQFIVSIENQHTKKRTEMSSMPVNHLLLSFKLTDVIRLKGSTNSGDGVGLYKYCATTISATGTQLPNLSVQILHEHG